ncbi:hypothetical protein B0H19DRAFT_851165, partial [Mycena capillaripes]
VVLSGHAPGMERMRLSERYKLQLSRKWRLCRFCKDHLEDAIHAMFTCKHIPLVNIRTTFCENLVTTHPELRGVYSDTGPF